MYAPLFDYYKAGSVKEAVELLGKHPGAKLLAGGHSLIPLMKLRLAAPPVLVDVGRVDALKGIERANRSIRIGAMTTHAELAASPVLQAHCPALATAAGQVGDPAVRNRGTIGGNVAHADPASDLPIVLTLLEARFAVTGPNGERTVDSDSFFTGMMETALDDGELVTAIEVPVIGADSGATYVKFAHPASRYAVIGVGASITMDGQKCTAAGVAVGGLVPRPIRANNVERALVGQVISDETIGGAARQVAGDLGNDILGDIFASAEYRKAVAPVWVRRALRAAAPMVT